MNSFGPTLGALLVALLAIGAVRGQFPDKYEPEKEYIYEYIGYSLSGRPDSSRYSGFKFNASLCLSMVKKIKGGFHMQLQFKKGRLDRVNGDISPFLPWREDSPRKLTASKAFKKMMVDFTKGVLHFDWKDGLVNNVRKFKSEGHDITNLKKGALGLFNFDLSRMQDKKETSLVDWSYENGLEGNCKTGYVAMMTGANEMKLDRIRNLYDCANSTTKIHRFLRGRACSKDGSLYGTPLRADSVTSLQLSRDSSKSTFFVRIANSVSQYILPNPNAPELMVGSYIGQELTFDQIKKKPKKVQGKFEATTIAAVVIKDAFGKKKDTSKPLRKEIDSYLKTLKKSDNGVKFNTAVKDLVSAMRQASVKDLNYALKKAKSFGKRVETVMYDVFGNVGTKEAQEIIFAKINDAKTSDARAACMLRSLAFSTLDPSGLENAIMKTADEKRLQKKDRVKTLQTLWMMAGALHCRLERKNDKKMAAWLRKQLETEHPNMDEDAKITTLLMAVGNAGAKPSLNDMLSAAAKMKKAKKLTLRLQLHGVHALRKYAAMPELQSKIRTILWPIFADYRQDAELRICAFKNLIKTNPSRRHMAILMNQLRKERCRHVRNYVVSYLQLIAKSGRRSPCRMQLAKIVRWALPSMPGNNRWNPGMFQSRILFLPIMKSVGIFMSIIYGRDSALPRSVSFGELFADDQTETNLWTMTIRSEESGELLRNIASPSGSIIDRIKMLFKEFKGKKGKALGPQTTAHYSLSGEDAGYYGTTFLGSKSNPMKAIQTLLKLGRNTNSKTILMDSEAHMPTALGTTLNWWGSASGSHEMSFKMKGNSMTLSCGMTGVIETALGFSYGSSCGHAMMRYYQVIHPGKPQNLVMMLTNSDKKKFSFALHAMPHKDVANVAKMGVQHLQAIREGRTEAKYYHMNPINNNKKTERSMGPYKITMNGLTKGGFNRVTRRGEVQLRSMIRKLAQPFEMTLQRVSKYCGIQIDMELKKSPSEAAPPVTTKIGARKIKLIKNLKSGKIRGSPARPYVRPLGLQQFANAEATMTLKLFKMKKGKMKEVRLGVGDLKIGPSGDKMDLEIRPRLGDKITLSYNRRVIGALPYYDINNPFTITTNAGSKGTLVIKQGDKTIAKLTRQSTISQYWINEWKRILKNPASIATIWPDVYQCYTDVQNNFTGSPSCYRAWRQLQTFDTVTSEVESPGFEVFPMIQQRIGSNVAQLYTFIKQEKVQNKDGAVVKKISASMCPGDVRAVDNNQKYYARVLDGFPRRVTCTLSYFVKQRKMYVRTFDGLNYVGSLPGPSTKGKGFIVTRDFKRNEFSVGIGSFKSGTRYVVIYSSVKKGKPCKAIAYQKPKRKPKFNLKGCKKDVVAGKQGGIYYVNFQSLGVKVMITGKTEISVQVNRMLYLNSLQGLCGNFDQEKEYLELQACNNEKVTYYNNNKFGWDSMVTSYMTSSISKFKGCA